MGGAGRQEQLTVSVALPHKPAARGLFLSDAQPLALAWINLRVG
ncbi:MAG: hypothetical protein H6R17_3733 [Proteobacteria bacterium]|nr:hypothetical protein [Pseudomonadota bacterium]